MENTYLTVLNFVYYCYAFVTYSNFVCFPVLFSILDFYLFLHLIMNSFDLIKPEECFIIFTRFNFNYYFNLMCFIIFVDLSHY